MALAGGDAGKAIEFLERVRHNLPLEGMLDQGQACVQSGNLAGAAATHLQAAAFEPEDARYQRQVI